MLAHPLSRLAAPFLVLLSLVIINIPKLLPASAGAAPDALVVHEWGTFTAVVGRDGYALSWRPLSFESDLPAFVYSVDKGATWRGRPLRYPTKSSFSVTVRMETPVIYFYAKEETNVSVSVYFPRGRITEWYPRLRRQIDSNARRQAQHVRLPPTTSAGAFRRGTIRPPSR